MSRKRGRNKKQKRGDNPGNTTNQPPCVGNKKTTHASKTARASVEASEHSSLTIQGSENVDTVTARRSDKDGFEEGRGDSERCDLTWVVSSAMTVTMVVVVVIFGLCLYYPCLFSRLE
ncbi:hypothetical protein ACOMHN_017386 [Nucella lapillus]